MKNKIISGFLTALMCVSLINPYIFRNIDAFAEVTANEDETLSGYAERVWEIVNEERAKEGLNPVTFNPQLNYTANIRASEIIQNGDHNRPDGSNWHTVLDENKISISSGGENILSMTNMFPVADVAMSAWMGSQIHRDNIMNGNFTNIGVGVAQEGDSYYIVQIFANEAVSWDISDGKLILNGTGRTPSYDPDKRPWHDQLDNITSTSVGSNITEIGRYLFSGMNNLQSATMPESVKKIDVYAFDECSSLSELIFMNPECEIEGSNETIPSGTVICGYENSTAQTFAETYGYNFKVLENTPTTLGDVNSDGFVDALDATDVLVEYASLSTEGISTFTDEQKASADINADGEINSVDSSYILAYYAYLSTGGTETDMKNWLEFYESDEPVTQPETTTTETEPETTTTTTITTEPEPVLADYSLYVDSLNVLSQNDETNNYCICDIDNDGTYELITENNGKKNGYSIKNGEIIPVDESRINDFINNNPPKYYKCDDMSGLNRIMFDEPYTYYDTTDSGDGFIFNKKQSSDKGKVVNTGSVNLKLRARPTTDSDIITEMPENSEINVYGHNSNWAYVSYEKDGKISYGYASTNYISCASLMTSYNSNGLAITDVNMRSEPTTDSDIVMVVPKNYTVKIYGYNDGWYKVSYQTGVLTYDGYISRTYIIDTSTIDWQSAYKQKLSTLASKYDFSSNQAMYDLVDINGNGIPELIISDGTYHAAGCHVYTYTNDGYAETTFSDGRAGFSEYGEMGVDTENHIAKNYYYGMGYEYVDFYRLEGTQFVHLASFSNDEGNDGSNYQYNGNPVTKSQYQEYRSQYGYNFYAYGRRYTYTPAWKSAYNTKISSLKSQYTFSSSGYMYDSVDINGDGIPEIILSDGTYHASICKVFTYLNGSYVATTLSDGSYGFAQNGTMGIDTKNHIAKSYYYGMGNEFVDFYRLDGTKFVHLASFSNDGSSYTYNGKSVTKSQYDSYRSNYGTSFVQYGRKYK